MRFVLVALAAGALLAAPASAQQTRLNAENFNVRTTGDLVRLCGVQPSDPDYAEAIGWCHGYGRGALDYHRAATPAAAPPLFCAPNPAPAWPEVLRAFLAWGNGNPQRAATPAVEGVFRFLMDTYPCPRR